MKSEQFNDICEKLIESKQKLRYVKFVKEAIGCGLKRAKCDIADVCFDDISYEPYELLTDEERLHLALFKRRRGTYSEKEITTNSYI